MSLAPAHWIRPNELSRQPACWIFLDTEAVIERRGVHQLQSWRCAVTCHDHRRGAYDDWRDPEWADHATPADLWAWIDQRCNKGERCVVVAHNLAYDLRIADAFTELPRLGWSLVQVRLDSEQTACKWKRDGRSLQMVDSTSWFSRTPLQALADDLELVKPDLPAGDDAALWLARCRADVVILRTAWLRVLHWLHDEDLGNWQPTGAGQAWTVWRHRHLTHRILVGDDPQVRADERTAAWCGRAEAWRHGTFTDGPFTEWDVELCYLRIMRDCEVPTRYIGTVDRPKPSKVDQWRQGHAVCASVTVTTDQPLVPTAGPDGILWPTGTFQTVLWGPELRVLDDAGVRYQVDRVHVYDQAPALESFARWLWPYVDGSDPDADQLIRRIAKHWSRALVGRFGVRYSQWEAYGAAPGPAVGLEGVTDLGTGERYRIMHLGDRTERETGKAEGENAVPAIMGMIMSETRRRLWSTMARAGLENVLHVDTDGVLTTPAGTARLLESGHAGVRAKTEWSRVEVIAPRQVVYDGNLRAPGVPRRARRVDARTWEGEAWQRLTTSLIVGELNTVRVAKRQVTLKARDSRRRHLSDGTTAAYDLGDDCVAATA